MESKSVGLDIGSSAVRAAEISLERNHCRLLAYGQVGLPTGAVVDGEVVNPLVVGEALRRLWSQAGFSTNKVVLGVSGHRVIVRQADVPALNEEDLRSSLRYSAQELIPIPMEDASFDFRVLERGEDTDDSGRSTARILIGAAHREMLRAHLAALKEAGLEAVAIDASPLALMRVVPPAGPDDGIEALVSIGAELTTVAVRQAGVPRFIRSLAVGGGKLTAGIAGALHVEPAVAETVKRNAYADGSPQLAQARKAISTELRDLGEDVRATIDFFVSQSAVGRIERVLVTGGASMTAGLAEELAGNTDVEVRRIDPFALLTIGDLGLDDASLRQARSTAATAVGLALWAVDPPQGRISLLPGDVAEARRTRRMAFLAGASVAGVAAILGFVGVAEGVAVHLANAKVHDADRQAAILQAKVTELQAKTSIHSKVQSRSNMVKSSLQGDVDWVQVINQLQSVMPSSLQFQAITATRNDVGGSAGTSSAQAGIGSVTFSVSGTGGLPAVAAWMDALQKDPSLQGTWISGVAVSTNGGNVTFTSAANLTSHAHSDRSQQVKP